jgi:soluble epoxide hydrolase / lipid-phosphate phosphatase
MSTEMIPKASTSSSPYLFRQIRDAVPLIGVSKDKYTINKPVIFIGAERDAVAVPKLFKPALDKFVPHLTSEVLDASHWVQSDCADEVNVNLERWILGL